MSHNYTSLENEDYERTRNRDAWFPIKNYLSTLKRMHVLLLTLGIVVCVIFFWPHASLGIGFNVWGPPHPSTRPSWPTLIERLKPNKSEAVQAATVVDMIGRVLSPSYVDQFVVVVNGSLSQSQDGGRDVFILETISSLTNNGTSTSQRLRISATTGVAAAAGFQYYLKKYCKGHVSWSGNQVHLPAKIPPLNATERVVANDLIRYYQNVCTASYSFVWWDWARWEREIDWMALNWINLPLASNGQEEIYRRVLLKLNFTQQDLDSFFTGPAFLAWNRMGNIDKWGGILPESWYTAQLQLQHKILERMRNFGMTPVLPAFAGHVPAAVQRIFPQVNFTRLDNWNDFNDTYSSTYLLDPRTELFQTIGKNLIDEMRDEFGVDHVYNSDTFNENTPPSNETEYLTSVGHAVFSSMTSADPEAIWLMQGWLFLDKFWTPTLAKALLTSVPLGRMLVLDLHADIRPLFQDFESYYGQPFVWCMLHNFGGTNGLNGAIGNVNRAPFDARSLPGITMVGTGITPEGIEQNDVIYELMNEMAWRTEPVDVDDWMADYAARRYGARNANASAAWQRLAQSAYNCTTESFHGRYVLTLRPSIKSDPHLCYDVIDLVLVYESFAKAAPELVTSDLFVHDFVDVIRETCVAATGGFLFMDIMIGYATKNSMFIQEIGDRMATMMTELDRLLYTDRRFRLSPWVSSARALATNEQEADLYEYNALNQITVWGPLGEIVDYAYKQWAGLFSNYYKPRWALFVNELQQSLRTSTPFNETQFKLDVFTQVEQPFTFSHVNVSAIRDPVTRADYIQELLHFQEKWMWVLNGYLAAGRTLAF